MAWTALTYIFESVLTSAKMTQNQDNFTALAQGLSGAPAILKAAIPSSVAYEDEANTFTANQKIEGVTPILRINATSGNPGVRLVQAGTDIINIYYDTTLGLLTIGQIGVSDFLKWDLTGKMTAGIVPLARMASATVINESGATVAANGTTTTTLGTGNDFYIAFVRATAGNFLYESATRIGTDDVITGQGAYAYFLTDGIGFDKNHRVQNNHDSNTLTYNRKVYRLQET